MMGEPEVAEKMRLLIQVFRESGWVGLWTGRCVIQGFSVCVCVCVYERQGEREKEREKEKS